MGNRRLSRKRLYQVEKAGIAVDLESGVGIKDAIVSATQHRNGQELITEIAIDFGTSKANILGGGAAGAPLGTSAAAAHITQLTKAKYGTITEIRAVLMEIPTSDGTAVNDLDIHFAATGGVQGTALSGTPGSSTEIIADLTAVGEDTSKDYNDHSTLGQNGTAKFLYVINGTGKSSADAVTGGKLLIYIHGFAEPADL